jgi:hypothetical protein
VFVALGIRHAMRTHHIVICCLPGSTYFFPPHYPTNDTIFRNEITELKMCTFIFSTILSEIFIILRKNERGIINNVHQSPRKVPVILDRF